MHITISKMKRFMFTPGDGATRSKEAECNVCEKMEAVTRRSVSVAVGGQRKVCVGRGRHR